MKNKLVYCFLFSDTYKKIIFIRSNNDLINVFITGTRAAGITIRTIAKKTLSYNWNGK